LRSWGKESENRGLNFPAVKKRGKKKKTEQRTAELQQPSWEEKDTQMERETVNARDNDKEGF
jgi:capsid protein